MQKLKNTPTANEVLNLISTPWATIKNIMKISGTGYNTSSKIFKKIKEEVEQEGYKLPPYVVPMERVVDYLKININYLKKVSQNEK